MNILDILETSDFFNNVSLKSKQAVAAICLPKHLKKNEMLFWEGDTGTSLYLLACGAVRIFKTTTEGRETVIKFIQLGELFAEVILFEKDTYPANAEAIKSTLIYELPKRRFHNLLNEPGFRNDFIRMLMQKQRYLAGQLHSLTVYDVEERFIRFLLDHYGEKDTYYITMSKKDVAAAIGTIPETMSRILNRLQREGTITVKGKAITVQKGFWQKRRAATDCR